MPVGPGDVWKHRIEAEMGQLGKVSYDLDYSFTKMATLDGANCAQLAISGSMSTVPGAAANEGFDLKSRKFSGVMYFDPELGAVRKFEIKSDLDLTAYGNEDARLDGIAHRVEEVQQVTLRCPAAGQPRLRSAS